MKLAEIKEAVRAGRKVCWIHSGYMVKRHIFRDGSEQWLVVHSGGHCIGLTHTDGVTMNGKPEDFKEVAP